MMHYFRLLAPIALLIAGCEDPPPKGPSSASVAHADDRGILVGEYHVPPGTKIGKYEILELWIERHEGMEENRLVVRLNGPHVDSEPRVRIEGLDDVEDYRHIWSERSGPPYEVWAAPEPVPDHLTLVGQDRKVTIRLKTKAAEQDEDANAGKAEEWACRAAIASQERSLQK